jgi:hypothetical protein
MSRKKQSENGESIRKAQWEASGWVAIIFGSVLAYVAILYSTTPNLGDYIAGGIGGVLSLYIYVHFYRLKRL